ACAMPSANAVDFSAKSSLIQTFEANSNYSMEPNPKGPTYLPVSTLLFNAAARTPTMRFGVDVDLIYRAYFGPGAETLIDGLDRRFHGSFEKTFKLTTFRLDATRSVQAASRLQLAETGTSNVSGDVTTDEIRGGVRHQLTPRDLVTVNA